jgi:hypothetical protein
VGDTRCNEYVGGLAALAALACGTDISGRRLKRDDVTAQSVRLLRYLTLPMIDCSSPAAYESQPVAIIE